MLLCESTLVRRFRLSLFCFILKQLIKPVFVVNYVAPMGCKVATKLTHCIVPLLERMRLGGAFLDVATSHAQLIKVLTAFQNVDLHYYFINFGPYTRPFETTSVSTAKSFEFMILRHLFDDAGIGGFTYPSNPSGAPDGQEGYVRKPISLHVFRHTCK